jgi:hypothetical protein
MALFSAFLVSVGVVGSLTGGPVYAQDSELTAAKLKEMLVGLAYEPKDIDAQPGREKYEVTIKTADFNIPIGAELSPSKRFVWLTVFLGKSSPQTKFEALLKQNAKIQPTFFWITNSGNLMAGMALDAKSLNPAGLKFGLDKVSQDVSDSAADWQS